MTRQLIIACLLVLANLPVQSADENGLFAIRGAGLLKCSDFSREKEAKSAAYSMIGGWLDGYITGINELSIRTFDISPIASTELLTVLIERHCADNPNDLLYAVVNALLARIHEDRLQASSPYVDVRVDLRQMRMYSDTILRIQSELREKGFMQPEPTGKWTLSTEKAIAAYQESVGLDGTGFPDQATVWRLLGPGG